MRKIIPSFLMALTCAFLSACVTQEHTPQTQLVDHHATAETQALYRNLRALQGRQVLFGHQDTLAYGTQWERAAERSDVKDVTGSFAAVAGWDLGGLELDKASNLDGVSFEFMRAAIKATYLRGGVTTISWHMVNPVTGESHVDNSLRAVEHIIPGGAEHGLFKAYLDKFVAFNDSLRIDGVQVPIIFRPWHEHNGEWFWWGKGQVTELDYIKLWQFTVHYLRDIKQQHNLLFAFSPDRSRIDLHTFEQDYFYAYPGDDYVDVIGLDNYWDLGHAANQATAAEQQVNFGASLAAIGRIAKAKHKLAALTEGGAEAIPNPKFWTESVLAGINSSPDAQQIVWGLVWRNAFNGGYNKQHYYAPYPGHPSAADFVQFKNDERILFEDELPTLYR